MEMRQCSIPLQPLQVVLHGKPYSWFVSDTLQGDLHQLVQDCETSSEAALATLGNRWKKHLEQGKLKTRCKMSSFEFPMLEFSRHTCVNVSNNWQPGTWKSYVHHLLPMIMLITL